MKINIYSLYLTFNKEDIKIFYDVLKEIIINNNHQNIKTIVSNQTNYIWYHR